jgi:acyl-CoA dehydrogenase
MALVLTEDQHMLKQAAKGFCQSNAPISLLRQLRDSNDSKGYDENIWHQIVELGWTGMTIPEAYGGFDFGYTGLGIVLEESGRTLLNSPLISTVLLCGTAINLGGSESQKQNLLPAIVAGESILALAIDELPHHNPTRVTTRATSEGDGFVLSGEKVMVLDGHVASQFIVSARTSGASDSESGISLFLVDSQSPGIVINRTSMVDGRNSANVAFEQVKVDADCLLGECDNGYHILEQVLDVGRIGIAAEMLGSMQEVFDRVIDYLKNREQFGVPIGSFQGLQHRAAEMYCEIELCKSVILAALDALDNDKNKVPELASLAKAKLSEVLNTVSNEGVQMHGGIGMTDEFDIGFFLKRARVAQQMLGDAIFHRNRYATLKQF